MSHQPTRRKTHVHCGEYYCWSGGNDKMLQAFKHAAPAMKQFQGFISLEIWTAPDGSMQAISRWTSQEALNEYTTNALFNHHHGGASGKQMNIPGQVSYYSWNNTVQGEHIAL
ncbi:antibiotic biosynthesis monooxygenase [Thermosporothrix hazakensis]